MNLAIAQTRLDESDSLTPKRHPDLDQYLDDLGPEVKEYMEKHFDDHKRIRTVSKKKDLPHRGRKMRTRY